ncbi:MAG: hypothetical protein Q7T74_01445 [Candidatus Saccharibacteria bacterium]|nr:hypothetical protein [Candidatus Saccharibacteria bacterium]
MKKKNKKQNKLQKVLSKQKKRYDDFLKRRPHRSFRMTARRDYKRQWNVPGYWSLTDEVWQTIWSDRWLFAKFTIVYSTLSFFVVGLLSQDSFVLLNKSVNQIGGDVIVGELSGVVQSLAVSAGVFSGAFTQGLTESQQIYSGLLFLVGWLTVVWLLRQKLAGHKNIKLRDGLYSSGSPILSTFLVLLVLLVQLVPFAIALIAYGAAESVDVFGDVLFTTLFWIVELLLVLVSMYWTTSTVVALVVVTLPGMYPLKALKASSDLVIGRRIRVLYRLAWLGITIVVIWTLVMLPIIFINQISWLSQIPIVPVAALIMTTFTLLWTASYVYLLYRKLVSDDTPTA